MKAFIHIRMFSHPYSGESKNEHSYYVSHSAGGLTARLKTLAVDSALSFLELRRRIEEREANGVARRTTIYNEFVHFMQRCPNPLGYQDKESLTSYCLGLLRVVDEKQASADDMRILGEDEETDPICDVVGDLLSVDLVLIPKTQIHPHTGLLADSM